MHTRSFLRDIYSDEYMRILFFSFICLFCGGCVIITLTENNEWSKMESFYFIGTGTGNGINSTTGEITY